MEYTYIVIQISGFLLVTLILGGMMLAGFRRSDAADRQFSERFSMLMHESISLTKETARKTDVAIDFLREQSILNRQILERVDKGR